MWQITLSFVCSTGQELALLTVAGVNVSGAGSRDGDTFDVVVKDVQVDNQLPFANPPVCVFSQPAAPRAPFARVRAQLRPSFPVHFKELRVDVQPLVLVSQTQRRVWGGDPSAGHRLRHASSVCTIRE